MGGIRGIFPGGPSRSGRVSSGGRRPPTLAQLSLAADRRRVAERRRRRARRRRVVALVALAGAAILGFGLGQASHASPETIRAEMEEANALDGTVSREVNRVLLELWKMEDVEATRGLRGRR